MDTLATETDNQNQNLVGLTACIERNMPDSFLDVSIGDWLESKRMGERLWKPTLGGSFDVFNIRPFLKAIVDYCVGDVLFLPALRNILWTQENYLLRDIICQETEKRVALSQTEEYEPSGRTKIRPPWNESHLTAMERIKSQPEGHTSTINLLRTTQILSALSFSDITK